MVSTLDSLNRSGNIEYVQVFIYFFPSLADRMFRLMDTNKDGFLNFQEVAKTFNLLCKGDHVLKLRLFYCLHLPGMVLPGELEELNKPHFGEETEVDGPEEGQYFISKEFIIQVFLGLGSLNLDSHFM